MNSLQPLRFGIIGCGRIALKHGEALARLHEGRLVAASDIILDRAEGFTKRFGGEAYRYRYFEEMLEHPDVDAICICTPSGMHAEQGIAAARAGKHVLVEKPMALSLHDADALIEACQDSGVTLGVAHQNRFNPAIRRLRAALEQGRFGQINMAAAAIRWHRDDAYYALAPWRGTWAQDGGCLMNQSIHNIDLLQWMMGPVESVYALTATRVRKIEVEDNAVAVVRFRNGALATIEASVTVYPKNLEETLSIFGANGTAVIGGIAVNRVETWRFAEGESEADVLASQEADSESVYGKGHQPLIADFITAVREGREPAIPGTEGRKALEIILGIYESSRSGRPVSFPMAEARV